jgi:hypothetical protein
VVSISTTRATPSALGLAQADFCATGAGGGAGGAGGAAGLPDSAAVTSTSSLAASFAGAGSGSAGRAAVVWGAACSAREEVKNHTPAITTAARTLASIRPNALRIAILSKYATKPAHFLRAQPLMRRNS